MRRFRRRRRAAPLLIFLAALCAVAALPVYLTSLPGDPRPLPELETPVVTVGMPQDVEASPLPAPGAPEPVYALTPGGRSAAPERFERAANLPHHPLEELAVGRDRQPPVAELRRRLEEWSPGTVLLPVPSTAERAAIYVSTLLALADLEPSPDLYLYGPEDELEASAGSRELLYTLEAPQGAELYLAPANRVRLGPGEEVTLRSTGEGSAPAALWVRHSGRALEFRPQKYPLRLHIWGAGEKIIYRSYAISGETGAVISLADLGDPGTVVAAVCEVQGERCGAAFALQP